MGPSLSVRVISHNRLIVQAKTKGLLYFSYTLNNINNFFLTFIYTDLLFNLHFLRFVTFVMSGRSGLCRLSTKYFFGYCIFVGIR